MKKIFYFIIIISVFSLILTAQNKIETKKIEKDELYYLQYEGKYRYGFKWKDDNGINFAVFSSDDEFTHATDYDEDSFIGSWQGFLYVYHYAGKNVKNLKLLRKIQDWNKEGCGTPPFGLNINFNYKTISFTDLDNDGLAEITFMYYMQCTSELAPVPTKLMMLEDGKKYAIRGANAVKDFKIDEVKNIDVSFNKAPESFKKFASELWDKNILHYDFEDDFVNDYPDKTLLNGEYISKYSWKADINQKDYKYFVPVGLKFNEDGTGEYTISGTKWLKFDWDCEKYPDLITNFPGKFKYIEGFLEYHVLDKDEKETVITYSE